MQKSIRFNLLAGAGAAVIAFSAFSFTESQKSIAANPPNDCNAQASEKSKEAPDDKTRVDVIPCSCPVFVIDDGNTPTNLNDDYWYCDRYQNDCDEDPGADVVQGNYAGATNSCENCIGVLSSTERVPFPGFREALPSGYRFPGPKASSYVTTIGPAMFIEIQAEKKDNRFVPVYAEVCRYTIKYDGKPYPFERDFYLGVEVSPDASPKFAIVKNAIRSYKPKKGAGCSSFEIPGLIPTLILTVKPGF